ncbi:glutathione S-transferase N-terminal domain-containing protein [Sphingomonas daechungensis]|uniref:glutathione S-transferase N-terminal domain-containing protein n=1 Tax=Sphingomonas daechungensis TaxID=1176646 RepID=UPI0037844C37
MIDFYTAGTPNGRKVAILLEEVALPYEVHRIDFSKNEQFRPEFLAVSPNNKIPAIVDRAGPGGKRLALFESGAILFYLSEKTGRFMPSDAAGRASVHQWLMWQMGGIGPMFGQLWHFTKAAPEKIAYAIDRYQKEVDRLLGVLERQLGKEPYLAGDYSIADMAVYPWVAGDWFGADPEKLPNFMRWKRMLAERPAVERGMKVP